MSATGPDLETMSLSSGQAPTDDIWEAMFTQRAIRYWRDKAVPRELLEKVVAAASKAPSGSNTQPWVFVVIDDARARGAIARALKETFESVAPLKEMVEAGSRPENENKTERLMLRGAKNFFSQLGTAPAVIVPCLYQLSSPTQDPTTLAAGSSIYLAVQNLLLAARALGLGTVMTTAHAMIEPTLREVLELPDDAHPVALVPIGYPDAKFGPTTRKPLEDILRWNHW